MACDSLARVMNAALEYKDYAHVICEIVLAVQKIKY